MKPALAAVVYKSPTCCKEAAMKSTAPASKPALSSEVCPAGVEGCFLENHQISGNREQLPRRKRTPLKAKGSRKFMPRRWATKPNPQIAAANNNIRLACILKSLVQHSDR